MNEFDLIRQYFQQTDTERADVALGIGDDCALLQPLAHHHLAVTTDTMVDGVHFDERLTPADLAYKLVAVNLSDLAAMGAVPCWVSLALTLPSSDQTWLSEFGQALAHQLRHYQVALVGGDTTRGPLTLSLTAQGQVPAGQGLTRSGAAVGDVILVSGHLGDAALALNQHKLTPLTASQCARVEARLFRPTPRVELGLTLRQLASACIDISDGLSADLNHILERSSKALGGANASMSTVSLGACIDADKLPVSAEAVSVLGEQGAAANALNGGDDYELCFTVPATRLNEVIAAGKKANTPVTVIGEIVADGGLQTYYLGQAVDWQAQGYLHFSD
ncbi:thiamine-phosphate kinase [Neiella marina]|uniref:Thiamine-monophosphate kinase n=1 Tax=Neiella holothuriorum TaxID=2870530 RepID=A0ABS7EHJ3_9GAMM|nr:thiamine-phosphate kinase [Neiella holothuriorum]MBW8191808.1 thiamine-phosphate kinase [Neiella holothuriorum]